MNQGKMLRILELVWLAVGFAAILMCAYAAMQQNWREAGFLLLVTAVAGFMYWRRKKQRMWLEKNDK
jgi:ABC-type nickel/cobalt efflux system permease component RcnA